MRQALYEKAELLMLDHSHARVWRNATDLLPGVQMYQLALPSSLTTAYAISRMAAKTLIETSTPVRRLADWPCGVTDVDAVVAVPHIVGHPDQNTGVSHLRQERIATATHIKKRKLKKLSALLGLDFWRRWIIKRLSRRVS
jgi:glycosyl transferase family 25